MRLSNIDISFAAGEVSLELTNATGRIVIESHWLNDRFADLISCVNSLADNSVEIASCRWQGPVNEGHWIDFVKDPEQGLSLAIHTLRNPDSITSAGIWSAERGAAILVCHQPLDQFFSLFAAAIRRVRLAYVDADGLIKEYPRPFPYALFEQLESSAMRMGYHPTPLADLSID